MAVDFAELYRKMDPKRWKILDSIFHYMWKYEYIPSDLISKHSKIGLEKVEIILRDLSDKKLVLNKRLNYFGSSFTFKGLSLYSLWRLAEKDEVEMLGKLMGEGKESTVYNCISRYGESVIKFHRLGHPAFKKVREKRDYGTFHFSVLAVRSAKNEFQALNRLYGIVRTPRPLSWEGNAVLMEIIDAKELFKVRLSNPEYVLNLIIDEVKEMYKAGIIHGDLSQYNVLVSEEGVWLIDFPQFVDANSENAENYLLRDLNNIIKYFKKNYGIEKNVENVLEYVKSEKD